MFAIFQKFRERLSKPENVHLKIALSGFLVVLGLCVGIGGMKYTEAHETTAPSTVPVPGLAEKPKVKAAQSPKDDLVPEHGYIPKLDVKKTPSKEHAPASLTKAPKPGAKHQGTKAKRHQKLTKPPSKMHAKMTGSLVEEIHALDKVLKGLPGTTSEQGVKMKPIDYVVKGHEPKVEVRGHQPKRLKKYADGTHKAHANASPVIAKAHGAPKEGRTGKVLTTHSGFMPAVSHHKGMHKMPSGKWMNGPSHKEAMQKLVQEFGYKSNPLEDEMEVNQLKVS